MLSSHLRLGHRHRLATRALSRIELQWGTLKKPSLSNFSLTALVGIALFGSDASAAPKSALKAPALSAAKAGTLKLKNGTSVSSDKYVEEMNALQEAIEKDGFSLHKPDNKRPPVGKKVWAFPGQDNEIATDRKVFSTKVAAIQKINAANFSTLVKPKVKGALKAPAGAPSTGGSSATRPPSSGSSGNSATRPEPDDEPLSSTYEEVLGSKEKAGIYANFGLNDDTDAASVGCAASLEGGAYVFKEKVALAKVVLSGKASQSSVSGSAEVFILGKAMAGFPKSGSADLPALTKTISSPEIGYTYGWGPISVGVTASVAGEFGLAISNKQEKANTGGKCSLTLTPFVKGSAKATAKVNAIAYQVGIEGVITLIDLSLPATATVWLTQSPLALNETFNASLKTKFLDGGIAFFVKTNIPDDGEKWTDWDWDTVYKKSFFEWDGFTASEKLASFNAKQTLIK